jgi:hypothetical protein
MTEEVGSHALSERIEELQRLFYILGGNQWVSGIGGTARTGQPSGTPVQANTLTRDAFVGAYLLDHEAHTVIDITTSVTEITDFQDIPDPDPDIEGTITFSIDTNGADTELVICTSSA